MLPLEHNQAHLNMLLNYYSVAENKSELFFFKIKALLHGIQSVRVPPKQAIIHSDTRPSTTAFPFDSDQSQQSVTVLLPLSPPPCPEPPVSPYHSCVLYSACTNSSRMIIVFDFYSIIDTHVNTVHLQLNTCHLLSLV